MSKVRIDPGLRPTLAADPAAFIRAAFEGAALAPMIQERLQGLSGGPGDCAPLLELGLLFQLAGERERALQCRALALDGCRLYRHPAPDPPSLRVLALVTAGDLMANTPFELMIEGRGMEVAKLYLDAGQALPEAVPEHDVAIMAIGESDESRPLLEQLSGIESYWPRPMLNRAGPVLELARDRLYLGLEDAPGVLIPPTVRIPRGELLHPSEGGALRRLFQPGGGSIIIRPVGSHAGKALSRIHDDAALAVYLADEEAEVFYVSPFVDYAGADGLYRKYRIALFDGRPFLCHMAVSEHWMVHYLNAGMAESEAKRAQEQRAMEGFDDGLASRHAQAFQSLHDRIGLDDFAIDCAETRDGRLLIFEADVAMIIHALDSEALYPYKKRQMLKVFDAFEALLRTRLNAAPEQA